MAAPGLEKGLTILEYVDKNGRAGFTELMTELDLNKASLSRFLKVLVEKKYLLKAEGSYLPGEGMARFSQARPWKSTIYPLLSQISRETECSVLWVEFVRGRLHFVERIVRENGVNVHESGQWGTNYLVNPAGYILLGHSLPDARSLLIKEARYSPEQESRIPSPDLVLDWISKAEKEGYFDDRGLIIPGIRRGALPIFREGKLIGALVLGMVALLADDQSIGDKLSRTREILK